MVDHQQENTFTNKLNSELPTTSQFNRKHFQIILFYGIANIFRAVATLIGGPLYSPEAEKKGVSGTEIGIVFAAQELAVFFMSLIYGTKIIKKIGPQTVLIVSFFGIGICVILFGCLALIQDRTKFVILSILVKIFTGIFDGGIYPAAITIFTIEAPNSISTSIAVFEVFFGIGAVGGPVLCGLLYEIIGFTWVYTTVGSCIIASGIGILCFVPTVLQNTTASNLGDTTQSSRIGINNPGILNLLKIPTVLLVLLSLSTASASIGFITATLALHYSYLNPTMTGALFSAGTAIYTVLCPVWGYAADHGYISKTTIIVNAAVFVIIGFSFLGPLPFLPLFKATWSGFLGYAIHGIGISGSIMTSYHHALEAAILEGFPDTSQTYSLVSSVYIATFSLGNAIGPTVSGVLYDLVGFRWGTMFVIGLAFIVILCTLFLKIFQFKKGIHRLPM